jgi:hypothetical protein
MVCEDAHFSDVSDVEPDSHDESLQTPHRKEMPPARGLKILADLKKQRMLQSPKISDASDEDYIPNSDDEFSSGSKSLSDDNSDKTECMPSKPHPCVSFECSEWFAVRGQHKCFNLWAKDASATLDGIIPNSNEEISCFWMMM